MAEGLSTDTILAVSSPPGRSARGMIRISGPDLGPFIAQSLVPGPAAGRLTLCRLRSPALPCLVLFHAAPRSFTGQDVLEIQLPGNPALIERVLHTCLSALRRHDHGARLAQPGEFAQRAFMSGRIDLTRAEGIAATIGAVSEAQLQAARLLRTGRLGQWADQLIDSLARLLALVEAGIDFVDQDDVVPISPARLDEGLGALERDLQQMIARSRPWAALEAMPWVVLIGRPNAGKSTLFNALLGRERAVTSALAGTTRDVLAEPLRIDTPTGQAEVMLVDIAGLDTPQGFLDAAMQSAAQAAIDRAELLLSVRDTTEVTPLDPPRTDVPVIGVLTKTDLTPPSHGLAGGAQDGRCVAVSATTGQGLDDLRQQIARAVGERAVALGGQMMALAPRHLDELSAAAAAVAEARGLVVPFRQQAALAHVELVAESMRRALDHLSALGGHVTSDDIIGRIFATFCIGK